METFIAVEEFVRNYMTDPNYRIDFQLSERTCRNDVVLMNMEVMGT